MHTSLCPLITGRLGLMLLVRCSSPEQQARVLLEEASRLVSSAQEAEQTSYPAAATLYEEALTKAAALTTQYPCRQPP